jgi:hypothetical protein
MFIVLGIYTVKSGAVARLGTLGVPGLILFRAYLYTHRGAKGVKKSKNQFYK